ncbi:sigma-70 family RNA polymerase sigma factor [Massilibacteroides sp.]|uniref:RNA polymerase sigma factor n=1 Tax=Massilibacteroides sp. TaxID=2034766 RepID=UPI002621E992|nr:sigma-70 family RNA polymerase sigma factor [Massilibacteroides sp.]MDD4514554.1 sigma-70 family RNA polymerase sigma factor [Massilibacteroides sp.]
MELETFKKKLLPLRKKMINVAYQFMQDKEDAEDIVQETFLKLWTIRNDLEQYNSLEALTIQMVKNKSIDRLRARRTERIGETESLLESKELTPEKILEEHDAVGQIRRIVDGLPELQQLIIRMKDIEGYEIAEIAEITGTQIEAVRVNLSRARKRVRDLFMKLNNGRYEN